MEGKQQQTELASARKGLIRAIWSTSVAPRFSSKPIMEDYLLDRSSFLGGDSTSSVASGGNHGNSEHPPSQRMVPGLFQGSIQESSNLTKSEHDYLEELLRSDDLKSIRLASTRLADKEIFPAAEEDEERRDVPEEKPANATLSSSTPPFSPPKDNEDEERNTPSPKPLQRRDSQVQQQLFQLHEKASIMPSTILKRMSGIAAAKASRPLFISHVNSLTQEDEPPVQPYDDEEEEKSPKDTIGVMPSWNPLKDLNTWIDGSEGVEVDNEGTPEISSPTSNPFKILGTSANDTSCHPHVLSPPLMEGLQLFMPESLQEHHYWLKYSLVRDGPGQLKMLRHCRASQQTVLAIETTNGHVFGSFTSQPWRLTSTKGYYGSKDSFVWRMRRSRNEEVDTIVEQILMESQMDVYPFTGRNNMVQLCTKDCLALGHGELQDESIGTNSKDDNEENQDSESESGPPHDFYGLAIKLDKSMRTGTTSSSETFGNPCLVKRESKGEAFKVANIELWSLTPHETEDEADRAEMRSLFLEEKRLAESNLNLIEILVGGAHI
ncbi:TLD domain containing protein [Nitzschia inconspicua]|uniref:Oxidation resistance protein 1 n=1 Tax=Nitzschia inconspicua TaxID=303405 RepID=A0A9K3PYC9_9STRA|nr:TLD domain containing protein [Nitzschia inconspicua]